MGLLKNRRALVTGGARRIGAAICEALAREGCEVVVHCHRSTTEAAALVESLETRYGVHATGVTGELGEPDATERIVQDAVAWRGPLDLLVNNASVFRKEGLQQMSAGSLDADLAVNAIAPVLLSRAFADQYDAPAGLGCIINLLDRRIARASAGEVPYQLSKRMLAAFTEIGAVELAPAIRVNGVAPGPVLPPPGEGDAYLREKAGPLLTAARCSPADVAAAVVFLAVSPTITGQVVFVDSGQHLLA